MLLYLGRKPVVVPTPGIRVELLTPMSLTWPLGVITASKLEKPNKVRPELSTVGQQVNAQFWGRAPHSAPGTFLSSAVEYFVGP